MTTFVKAIIFVHPMNPWRTYLVAFLLLMMSAQFLSKTGFIVYFTLNRAKIAKELCENKNKPQLKCDGKCHLKKYVKAEQKKEQHTTQDTPSLPDLENFKTFNFYYIAQAFDTVLLPSISWGFAVSPLQKDAAFVYLSPKGNTFIQGVFHPPLL